MCTGFLRGTGQYFMKASPVRPATIGVLRGDRSSGRALGLSGRRLRRGAFERRGALPSAAGRGVQAGRAASRLAQPGPERLPDARPRRGGRARMRPGGRGELDSLYFDYPHFDLKPVPELRGERPTHPVAIVGAGPIGMTAALALAAYGVRSVLLDRRTRSTTAAAPPASRGRACISWSGSARSGLRREGARLALRPQLLRHAADLPAGDAASGRREVRADVQPPAAVHREVPPRRRHAPAADRHALAERRGGRGAGRLRRDARRRDGGRPLRPQVNGCWRRTARARPPEHDGPQARGREPRGALRHRRRADGARLPTERRAFFDSRAIPAARC